MLSTPIFHEDNLRLIKKNGKENFILSKFFHEDVLEIITVQLL